MTQPTIPSPESSIDRCAFLKTSVTATAAVSLASLDLSRFAHAAGNDTLKVGMIGCGGRNTGAGAQALNFSTGAAAPVQKACVRLPNSETPERTTDPRPR